jgi:hypothetical protein
MVTHVVGDRSKRVQVSGILAFRDVESARTARNYASEGFILLVAAQCGERNDNDINTGGVRHFAERSALCALDHRSWPKVADDECRRSTTCPSRPSSTVRVRLAPTFEPMIATN